MKFPLKISVEHLKKQLQKLDALCYSGTMFWNPGLID